MVEIKLLKTDKAKTQLTTNIIKIKTCWNPLGMVSFLSDTLSSLILLPLTESELCL